MAQQWFYTKDGKSKIGPVTSTALQALAQSGQLLPTDMVWKEGMPKWVPAQKVKGLLFPKTPAPVALPPVPLEEIPMVLPVERVFHKG